MEMVWRDQPVPHDMQANPIGEITSLQYRLICGQESLWRNCRSCRLSVKSSGVSDRALVHSSWPSLQAHRRPYLPIHFPAPNLSTCVNLEAPQKGLRGFSPGNVRALNCYSGMWTKPFKCASCCQREFSTSLPSMSIHAGCQLLSILNSQTRNIKEPFLSNLPSSPPMILTWATDADVEPTAIAQRWHSLA